MPPSISRRASRPEAPIFTFGFDDVRLAPETEARAPEPPGPGPTSTVPSICAHCGANNPKTHRFCTTCGGTIAPSTVLPAIAASAGASPSAGSPAGGGAPTASPVVASSVAAHPVVGDPSSTGAEAAESAPDSVVMAAVVAIAVPTPVATATVTCVRCQGQCAASARFCKYCGATLTTPASVAPPSASSSLEPVDALRAMATAAKPPSAAPPGGAAALGDAAGWAPVSTPSGHAPTQLPQLHVAPQSYPQPPVQPQPYAQPQGSPQYPQPSPQYPQPSPHPYPQAQPQPAQPQGPMPQGPMPQAQVPQAQVPQAQVPQAEVVPQAQVPQVPQAQRSTQPAAAQPHAPASPQPGSPPAPPADVHSAAPMQRPHSAPPAAGAPGGAPEPTTASSAGAALHLRAPEARAPSADLRGSAAPIPATARSTPRLVVLRDDGSEGNAFGLEQDIVDLGRREGDILLHDDFFVSPRHARFRREGEKVRVIDLASTNGIYLRLRAPHRLATGNLILMGLEVLQFQLVKDAAPPGSSHAPSASAGRGPWPPGAVGPSAIAGAQNDPDATIAGGRSPAASASRAGETWGAGSFGQASQHGTLVFGSPGAPRRASLHQRTVEGVVRDVYHLMRDEVVLGREGADIVFSADPFISRRHAAIRRDPASDVYTLADLDSSNGTFLRIENDAYLSDGDEIRIGRHLFRFDTGSAGARGHGGSQASLA